MYYEDPYDPTQPNDVDDYELEKMKNNGSSLLGFQSGDKGLSIITRPVVLENGYVKNKRIKIFASGSAGSRIRDAETGEYYPNIVGSKDEDLFYKVNVATGECNSSNGSSTLFFCSPQHYMNYLLSDVSPEKVASWEKRRDARLKEINLEKRSRFSNSEQSNEQDKANLATRSKNFKWVDLLK